MSISATFLNTEFLQTALQLGSYTQILNFQPNYPNILLINRYSHKSIHFSYVAVFLLLNLGIRSCFQDFDKLDFQNF